MITLDPIGIIHTPHEQPDGMPIQPVGATCVRGEIVIREAYTDGLKDLDGFSHIYLIYIFHRMDQHKLLVKPFLDNTLRGVYATRAPSRPNHIGLSLVKLISIDGNRIVFEGADMLDGTPLLDIKPYVPDFESPEDVTTGWLDTKAIEARKHRSDRRFAEEAGQTGVEFEK